MVHTLTFPDFALIVLMGASGSGKSTFARTHFKPTEVIASDTCRGWISDPELTLCAVAARQVYVEPTHPWQAPVRNP